MFSFSDVLVIGPFSLPVFAAAVIITGLVAFFAGIYFLKGEKEKKKIFTEVFFSPVLPLFLGWKLSILLTDFQDVISNPKLLLYSSGSMINILIGVILASGWLSYKWIKLQTDSRINKAIILSLSIIALFFLVSNISFLPEENSSETQEKISSLELYGNDGKTKLIPDLSSGKVTVINFWASWCPPCRAEMPVLQRMYDNGYFKDINFYAVNAAYSEKHKNDGTGWLEKNNFSIPVLYDYSGRAAADCGIKSLPTTIVIDKNGNVVSIKTGSVSKTWLKVSINKAQQ